jgi:hypothetical protein
MSSYYPFQVLPIVDSEMLCWVVYDDRHHVLGTGMAVTESDAHTAVKLFVGHLKVEAREGDIEIN